jgi:hypothetical protein
MANNYVYGYTGPPFNFLGHFCQTQWTAFQAYVNSVSPNLPAIQQHYQIRAAQLRKTSGVLEKFYSTANTPALAPTFNKTVWKPGTQGHFSYPFRQDHLPMVAMSQIKAYLKEQLQRMDEGVFSMNQLRNLIEKTEDKAEVAQIAATDPTRDITALIAQINGYFGLPEYEAVLVNDTGNVYPSGTTQPRFRVHQLDAPTQWEVEQTSMAAAGTGPSIDTSEVGTGQT